MGTPVNIKVEEQDKNYLLRLKKSRGYDSIRTVVNRMIKQIKFHKMEEEI